MGDHLGNQKKIREAMVVRPGQSGQYYDAVIAGLLHLVSNRKWEQTNEDASRRMPRTARATPNE